MKKIVFLAAISTVFVFGGEPNRATLDNIKEATKILVDEVVVLSENHPALKTRVAAVEINQKKILLDEEKIKKNSYISPSVYDESIMQYLGKAETK